MSIPDSRQQTGLTAKATTQARNALRVSWIILGAAVVLFVYNLYTAILDPVWQQFAIVGVSLLMGLASVVSVWLIKRGRSDGGAWFAIGGILMVCLAGAFLFKGLGLLLGVAAVLLTSMVAGQSLVQRQATRAVAVGVFVGLLVLFIELNEPTWRISAVSPTTATIIVIALVLIYGISAARQFANYTLRTKLIIAFLAVSLIPLSLIFYLTDRATTAAITDNVGANLKSLAESKALVVGDQLMRQVDMLRLLGTNKTVESGVRNFELDNYAGDRAAIPAQLQKLDQQWRAADAANNDDDPLVRARLYNEAATELRDFAKLFPGNAQVLVTDRYGGLVAATSRTANYYHADQNWWQAAWNSGRGAIYIGQPEFDESRQAFSIVIAAPTYSTVRTVIGVLRTTYLVNTFSQSLTGVRLGRTGLAELYLPGGQVLTVLGIQTQSDPEMLTKVRAISGNYAELVYLGRPTLVSQSPVAATTGDPMIANLGWRLVVYQERAESLVRVQEQTRSALLLALAIAVLVTGAAVGAAQVLAGPITRLTAVAEKVTAGDLTAQATVEARDEVGALAGTFNTMVAQLRQTLAGLERRVAERTHELERRATQIATAAQVAQVATTALDPEQLIAQVVELVQERFGYYYVGLFLVADPRQGGDTPLKGVLGTGNRYAVLQAGSGEAGRTMKERGHRLEVGGQSMVGWACANGQARIALDVGEERVRFDNPLLPNTRSEMALPLRAGGRVVGALDVQSVHAVAFDQSDIAALQGMADQIGVALENARLFQQTQRAVQDLDEANRLLVRQGWQEFLTTTGGERHAEFSSEGVRMVGASGYILRLPLELRGQTLGTLVMERGEGGRPWTDDEAEAIHAIVQQSALALDGARLFEETQQRAQREQLAAQITAKMRAAPDVSGILRTSVHEVRRALGATHGVIRLEKPRTAREDESQTQVAPAVLIQLRGQVLGTIDLSETMDEHQWTEEDVTLVTTIADQVAIALENARLLSDAQRRAVRERLISEITTRIRNSATMEGVLNAAVREIGQATGANFAAIELELAETE